MAKRIILISSFPICVALVIIAIVLAGVGRGQLTATPVDIDNPPGKMFTFSENFISL